MKDNLLLSTVLQTFSDREFILESYRIRFIVVLNILIYIRRLNDRRSQTVGYVLFRTPLKVETDPTLAARRSRRIRGNVEKPSSRVHIL